MRWSTRPAAFDDGCPARAVLHRMLLRRAATSYAEHGWWVVRGARLCGDRFSCGPGCRTVGPHPVVPGRWEESATRDAATVAAQWRHTPHTVLLATGEAFDVVDVPAYIGVLVRDAARGPVAVTPSGRWMFLVRPGGHLHPDLAGHHGVVLHGPRSWIPAPPTRTPQGRVRWVVAPHETNWRVADWVRVQDALAGTLPGRPSKRAALPYAA